MKNILFATTALVATAGIASADVSLSGVANVGIIDNGIEIGGGTENAVATTNSSAQMYQNISITATGSGETDGGLTFGATLTIRAGDDVDLDAGDLGTNDAGTVVDGDDNILANSGDITALSDISYGSIYVSGEFGKLTFDRDGLDNVMDDVVGTHDVQYDYSGGGLTVAISADIDNNDAAYGDHEEWAAKIGYTMDALTFTVATDDTSESDVTVAYAVNDMITASVNFDSDGQSVNDADTDETIVKVAYANDGVSAHLAWADDDDDAWEVGLGYTAGAMSFSAVVAENDGATVAGTEYDVTASYDLGGGMSLKAATNETGAYFVGTALAF